MWTFYIYTHVNVFESREDTVAPPNIFVGSMETMNYLISLWFIFVFCFVNMFNESHGN